MPTDIEKLSTDYGLETDFRADLIADVDALAAAQSQQDAKREIIGDTAQIGSLSTNAGPRQKPTLIGKQGYLRPSLFLIPN